MTDEKTDEKLIRVNVVLSQDALQVFDDYKRLMNVSRSSLLRALISEALPNLKRILNALEGFDKLPAGERALKISKLGEVSNQLDETINTFITEL